MVVGVMEDDVVVVLRHCGLESVCDGLQETLRYTWHGSRL